MNFHFKQTMADVTRLVRSGDLRGATALIQTALHRNGSAAPTPGQEHAAPPPSQAFSDAVVHPVADVIDVDARFVPEPKPGAHATSASGPQSAPEPTGFTSSGFTPSGFTPSGFTPSGFTPPGSEPSGAHSAWFKSAWFDPSVIEPVRERERDVEAPPTIDSHPEGQFLAGSFALAHDHRDYKLYIPPDAGQRALPLVVMLHGCTQNPDDFAAGTAMNEAALAQGFYVLYPAQSRRANPQGCWNWFKHNHQKRDRGEPALIAGMTRDVMARYRIDANQVYVAGLSAGGAMSAVLGDAYPELFAAVGVHSGLAAGSANDMPSAMMAMMSGGSGPAKGRGSSDVPTIVFHGDADSTVHPGNGDHVVGACVVDGCAVEKERVSAGGVRDATRSVYRRGDGHVLAELWTVHGAPHAWSGGSARGSFTDGTGPDATAEMLRFFFEHPRAPAM